MRKDQVVDKIMLDIEKKLNSARVEIGIEELEDLEEIKYRLELLVNKYSYEGDE